MATATQLKGSGFLEFGELVERVAGETGASADTYRVWLQMPLNKIRALLVYKKLIVQPSDRKWRCLYSPKLETFLVAYIARHEFGTRFSVAECVQFYKDFYAGKTGALKYLSPGLQRRVRSGALILPFRQPPVQNQGQKTSRSRRAS